MLGGQHVTIYNRLVVEGAETWQRSVLSDVRWEDRRASNQVSAGHVAADSVALYIPFSSGADYLQKTAWLALEDRTGKWTLQRGDMLVRGEVDDELSASFTPTALRAKYDDVAVIRSFDTNDSGSDLSHWRVGAS